MKVRSAVATTAAILGVLATTASCSSASQAPATPRAAAPVTPQATVSAAPSASVVATPSIPASTLSWYFINLRDPADGAGGDDQRLAAGHTPDSVLISAGVLACEGLRRGGSASFTLVEQKGWDETDAMDIAFSAAHSGLCKALGLGPTASPSSN